MPKMTPEQQAAATKKKLAELYALSPPQKAAPPPAKPSVLENYETLGKKMKLSGERAMGRKK